MKQSSSSGTRRSCIRRGGSSIRRSCERSCRSSCDGRYWFLAEAEHLRRVVEHVAPRVGVSASVVSSVIVLALMEEVHEWIAAGIRFVV